MNFLLATFIAGCVRAQAAVPAVPIPVSSPTAASPAAPKPAPGEWLLTAFGPVTLFDVSRQRTSGIDCAIAGMATGVAAAARAPVFKKSRRFIRSSPRIILDAILALFLARPGRNEKT